LKDRIRSFVRGYPFMVYIGTDSDTRDGVTVYATVLVIYRYGNGGTYFYTLRKEKGNGDMYLRIFKEVEMSLEMANFVKEFLGFKDFEIHLDIGNDGLSSKILPSVIGYVKGMGYKYKIKPWAFAASKIAHRHTK